MLIYVQKELELADVERLFPPQRYVMIDDKLRILDAIKRIWNDRVTTVFPGKGTMRLTRLSWRNFHRPTLRSTASETC